jgi:hypothetical protein
VVGQASRPRYACGLAAVGFVACFIPTVGAILGRNATPSAPPQRGGRPYRAPPDTLTSAVELSSCAHKGRPFVKSAVPSGHLPRASPNSIEDPPQSTHRAARRARSFGWWGASSSHMRRRGMRPWLQCRERGPGPVPRPANLVNAAGGLVAVRVDSAFNIHDVIPGAFDAVLGLDHRKDELRCPQSDLGSQGVGLVPDPPYERNLGRRRETVKTPSLPTPK